MTASSSHPRRAPFLLDGDIAGAFKKAAEQGCQGVELHLRRPGDLELSDIRQLMVKYDLQVPTLGTGITAAEEHLTFSDPDATVRERAVACVLAYVALAAKIGSAVTIGLISGRLGNCQDDERRVRRREALDCLAKVCEGARQLGVLMLLEPLNRYECDYINTLADGVAITGEIGAENLRLLADTFHMNIEETDLVTSLKAAGAMIGHVHLADTNRQAPGHGHMDVKGVLRALADIGYRGYLSFEVLPLPDADTSIQDAISTIWAAARAASLERNGIQVVGER